MPRSTGAYATVRFDPLTPLKVLSPPLGYSLAGHCCPVSPDAQPQRKRVGIAEGLTPDAEDGVITGSRSPGGLDDYQLPITPNGPTPDGCRFGRNGPVDIRVMLPPNRVVVRQAT
jgi:hypothetical protein